MKQRLLLKRSSEENKENSGSVKDCETLETQISDIKELISDTEDLCKELSKVYETRKMAFERVLEQERLNRISKESEFRREQQIMSGRTTTDGLSGRMTQKESRRVQVPQNLPKFRQKGPYDEPMEFLEAFRRVMEAHEVPLSRYVKLLPLCLDAVDCQWLEEWIEQQEFDISWQEVEHAFIAHFQNPNAILVWQEQIRSLKMMDQVFKGILISL